MRATALVYLSLSLSLGLSLALAACAAPTPARLLVVDAPESRTIPDERQAALAAMVKHDCGSCHGLTLKGGLGKPLLSERLQAYPKEALAALILGGVPGTAMPPWQGIVTREEALWISDGLRQGAFE